MARTGSGGQSGEATYADASGPEAVLQDPLAAVAALPASKIKHVDELGRLSIRERPPASAVLPLEEVKAGDVIEIELPGGVVRGMVNLAMRDGGIMRIAGDIAGKKDGTFSYALDTMRRLAGRIVLPSEGIMHLVKPEAGGGVSHMDTVPLSNEICYPMIPWNEPESSDPREREEAAPLLSSRPSAVAVLYLCFDGATVTDPDWNGGKTIIAARSYLSVAEIEQVWMRVSEDYSPFDINVTTDPAAYDNAPVGKRMRCIITPTSSWYAPVMGMAYVRSFRNSGRGYYSSTIPCWVFSQDAANAAETISHELGHTLGLSHDGRTHPSEVYFKGHGDWAPIMGSPYGKKVVQWSKGQYANANNPEDDLLVISSQANGFGYVHVDVGRSLDTATLLDSSTRRVFREDVIRHASDAAFYKIVLNVPSTLAITVAPQSPSPNLRAGLHLLDANGATLAQDQVPAAMHASIEAPIAAGVYYIKVDGVSYGNPETNGYSNYGCAGRYRLSLDYGEPPPMPEITLHPGGGVYSEADEQLLLRGAARGEGALSYQWRKDGADLAPSARISSVTADTLSIRAPEAGDSGEYTLAASNAAGTTVSNAARIEVVPLRVPVITGFAPPVAGPGSTVIITGSYFAAVTGVYFNNIAAESYTVNSSTQITARAPLTLNAPGRVTVGTRGGATVSPLSFTIAEPPSELLQLPVTQAVPSERNVLLTGGAKGYPAPGYHWQVSTDRGSTWRNVVDDEHHTGERTRRLSITNVVKGMHGHCYRYVADNGFGSAPSNAVTLFVTDKIFSSPVGMDMDPAGNLYVADSAEHTIQKITPELKVEPFAGSPGLRGMVNGTGVAAQFNRPLAVAFDDAGNLYVADSGNAVGRKITPEGVVTTIAGLPDMPGSQDGNSLSATLMSPSGIGMGGLGNILITDEQAHTVRQRSPDGELTTIIGAPGQPGSTEATGTNARLRNPMYVLVDNFGNTYIADTGNHVIRSISADGSVFAFAGRAGEAGAVDDFAIHARLNKPRGMDIDSADNLYFADRGSSTVRMITNDGEVMTIAGIAGISGLKDGVREEALFNQPCDVTFDGRGNLYVADTGNEAIRKITLATGQVTTLPLTFKTAKPPPPVNPVGDDNGGGGGGGGSPTLWYFGAIAALSGLRWLTNRRARRFKKQQGRLG